MVLEKHVDRIMEWKVYMSLDDRAFAGASLARQNIKASDTQVNYGISVVALFLLLA